MPGRPGPGTHLPCFPPQKDQVFRASKRSEALARCSVRREAEAHELPAVERERRDREGPALGASAPPPPPGLLGHQVRWPRWMRSRRCSSHWLSGELTEEAL